MQKNLPVARKDGESKRFRSIEEIFLNPAEKAKLTNLVDEAVRCKTRIQLEQETIKQLRETAKDELVGSSRVDLQACKLEYSIVSPK